MNDIDLNIDNYTFPELLNLFKIDNNYENVEHKQKMDTVLQKIHISFPNLSTFY